MAIVSVSLPDVLLDQMDGFIESRGFAGRSEIVRAALRDFLAAQSETDGKGGLRSATLTLLYPEGYEKKIGEVRHEFTDIIQSMMHSHTDAFCVEVFILRGEAQRIRQFADALRALREAELVSATYTDVRRQGQGQGQGQGHAHHGHAHGRAPARR